MGHGYLGRRPMYSNIENHSQIWDIFRTYTFHGHFDVLRWAIMLGFLVQSCLSFTKRQNWGFKEAHEDRQSICQGAEKYYVLRNTLKSYVCRFSVSQEENLERNFRKRQVLTLGQEAELASHVK